MTSAEVRAELIDALQIDLVGPTPEGLGDPAEWLDQAPSRWYLTGFLVPVGAGPAQSRDSDGEEEALETAEPAGDSCDDTPRERSALRERRLPSSVGLTVLLPETAQRLRIYVTWGDYRVEAAEGFSLEIWKRSPHSEPMELDVSLPITAAIETEVPRSDGLWVALLVRPRGGSWFEAGFSGAAKSVSVFLVNRRRPADTDGMKDRAFAFQVRLELQADHPFMALPGIRSLFARDWDEEVADLQYRDCGEYSIGHNVSTEAYLNDGVCGITRTCWTPRAEVERIDPLLSIQNVELRMSVLGGLVDGTDAWAKLSALPAAYRTQWIETQRARLAEIPEPKHRDTAEMLLIEAEAVARRIERGIELLNDNPQTLLAFCIANRAMSDSAAQTGGTLSNGGSPQWHPFQLAFILMNLEGIVTPESADRSRVDLLYFPASGGKTEACLGLAAFTMVLRRLLHPGITGAGTSVIVRHMLRLPPPARIARASAMICALELIRQTDLKSALGDWPFEIGLWDTKPPAPNQTAASLQSVTDAAQALFPLETCPWCGTAFTRDSFETAPAWRSGAPRVRCASNLCPFNGHDRWLPIVSPVGHFDESICRRLPCLVMATVDKLAAFPWLGRVGALFGKVDRYDRHGFYGPCDPGVGSGLPEGRLLPFDLLVQEDIDSVSGALGSILGLYESVSAELSANGTIRPKIVSSTTTVRKASARIMALFGRSEAGVFPPPGPDRNNSFFAHAVPASEAPGRLFAGVAAPGRNVRSTLLRVYLILLCRVQRFREDTASDPYGTLVGYFDTLRGMGGVRRLIEEEVRTRALSYVDRKRVRDMQSLFNPRDLGNLVVEVTGRLGTSPSAEAQRRLDLPMGHAESVDLPITTRAAGAALDRERLGLMVILGQPRTCSEFAQLTGRVGRDKPGFVVTVLNSGKPRDRARFERFDAFHKSFYRAAEAAGATPFSARALDRDLASAAVALARHGDRQMTTPGGADNIVTETASLGFVAETMGKRAETHAQGDPGELAALRRNVENNTRSLLKAWEAVSRDQQAADVRMKYYENEGNEPAFLLRDYRSQELRTLPPSNWKVRFRVKWGMRDPEPAVNLSVLGPGELNLDEDSG
jgi:hypothetical protein